MVLASLFWSFGDPKLNMFAYSCVPQKAKTANTTPFSTATLVESNALLVLQDGPEITSTKYSPFLILRGHTDAR